ncbi:uncharacterized protein RCC_11032 [Ramularia collo-cygni]|uniref:Uncharacterized protein n=1 Tax=Ramularia collo-cygni TaxID=112498 RepID=A0A2D3VQ26_9PEZI|nr:uncharacterized protein RCC_11032 [Ramularia collo-cygni]CZT25304.1 uncharacterized protein RCC_11032 [Ramularia collo-cygni]
MVIRTPRIVARAVKVEFSKLFAGLAPHLQSWKGHSKTQKESKDTVTIDPVSKETDDVQGEIRHSDGEEDNASFEEGDDATGLQLGDDHVSVEHVAEVEVDSSEPHDTTHLEGSKLRSGGMDRPDRKLILRNPDVARADSGAMMSSSVVAGAAKGACNDESSPESIHEPQHRQDHITIPHGSLIAQQLQTAVREHRTLKSLEHDADEQLEALENQASTISKQAQGLHDLIQDLKAGQTSTEVSSEIDALYGAISDLREAEEDNWQRQQRLKRHMSELYQDFRNEQCVLFDALDTTLVSQGLLPHAMRSAPAESSDADGSAMPTQQLRRSTTNITKALNRAEDSEQVASAAKTRATLLKDYVNKRAELETCEVRFYTKEALFDELERSRLKQIAAGEEVESVTEFDLCVCEETRQMTRDLINAEAEYEVSKAAAVAAGLQLKYSDIESGFVDDIDDGYRVSMEKDMIKECNRGRVEDWLAELEDKECPTRYLSVRDFEGMDLVDGTGVSALQDVGICDSRSMVAEGPSRRRIDRWTAQSW